MNAGTFAPPIPTSIAWRALRLDPTIALQAE